MLYKTCSVTCCAPLVRATNRLTGFLVFIALVYFAFAVVACVALRDVINLVILLSVFPITYIWFIFCGFTNLDVHSETVYCDVTRYRASNVNYQGKLLLAPKTLQSLFCGILDNLLQNKF